MGELTVIIDPRTSTLLSAIDHHYGTTKILVAAWTDDPPNIIPVPTK